MATNRAAISRSHRHLIRPEVIALFRELERVPMRQRGTDEFRERDRTLARKLGLTASWWGGNTVLDRSKGPCWPPWLCAHEDWYVVRRIREQLLAARID
jgi:hypothetical protein